MATPTKAEARPRSTKKTPTTERRSTKKTPTKTGSASSERLQKILSAAGIASRRAAEDLIREGRVSLNGKIVTELGTRANPYRDRVAIDGKQIGAPESLVYLALNKPVGVVTTLSDPDGRPSVADLLHRVRQRVFPVGRLDFQSSGLLLLTNDGELAMRLTHPRFHVEKTYRVKVHGHPDERTLERLRTGIRLSDGVTAPARVRVVEQVGRKSWLEIAISEGKNHQIRRMCEAVNLPVDKLQRISIGPLELGKLPSGASRRLSEGDVSRLKRAVGLAP
jgi:pseudouridine synthase